MSTSFPTVSSAPCSSAPCSSAVGPARRGSVWRTLFTLLVGFVLGGLTVAGVALYYASVEVPDFYSRAMNEVPPPAERRAAAEEFETRTVELARAVEYRRTWEQSFTQAQINAYLAQGMPEELDGRIPDTVSDPLVDLSLPGAAQVGFRLSNSKFEGVVSVRLRPEVVGPNRLALHVESLKAGWFPLDPRAFSGQVTKYLNKHDVAHEWDLHPLPTIPGGEKPPPILTVLVTPPAGGRGGLSRGVLEEVEIDGGAIRIAGRRADPVRLTRR